MSKPQLRKATADKLRIDANNEWLSMRWRLGLKGLDIIARVYRGFCREAAIEYSPGLQPWVRQTKTGALKVAPIPPAPDAIWGGRASPRAARTYNNPKVYFRRKSEYILGFVNNRSRGRDPSPAMDLHSLRQRSDSLAI